MLVAPLVTFLARAPHDTRFPMLAGVLALPGGFIAASFATSAWQLLLSQGFLAGIGVGFIYVPSIAVVSQWFEKKRSLANGITSAGSGIGGILTSASTGRIIDKLSIAWALRITGILVFVMTMIAAMLIRDRNHVIQPSQHPFKIQLLRRLDVWLLLTWALLSIAGQMTLLYSLPDYALSVGISHSKASDLVIYLNVGTAAGRPCIGFISDKFGRFRVAGFITLICGVLCFALWLPSTSFGVTTLFAVLSGAILGLFWVVSLPPMHSRDVCS